MGGGWTAALSRFTVTAALSQLRFQSAAFSSSLQTPPPPPSSGPQQQQQNKKQLRRKNKRGKTQTHTKKRTVVFTFFEGSDGVAERGLSAGGGALAPTDRGLGAGFSRPGRLGQYDMCQTALPTADDHPPLPPQWCESCSHHQLQSHILTAKCR